MLAILLYVAADFANPLMPGAVCFDPDESVDGVGRPRASVIAAPAPAGAAGVAAAPAALPPVTLHAVSCRDARAARPAPRARAALPLVSDRPSDDA